MSSQRPFFLSGLLAALRQRATSFATQPAKKPQSSASTSASAFAATATATPRSISTSTAQAVTRSAATVAGACSSVVNSQTLHAPTRGPSVAPIGIPSVRRRGSDSSTEGFRDVLGVEKWYVGGRTLTGETKFYKLGVVRRVRSNDGLSLDKLSL